MRVDGDEDSTAVGEKNCCESGGLRLHMSEGKGREGQQLDWSGERNERERMRRLTGGSSPSRRPSQKLPLESSDEEAGSQPADCLRMKRTIREAAWRTVMR